MSIRTRADWCGVCGWEKTTARCIYCRRPVCAGCAMPTISTHDEHGDPLEMGGPAIRTHNGRRGRVCPCRAE